MRRLFCILSVLLSAVFAGAQTRSYTDNATGTFIVGLENYFFGESGALKFQADGHEIQATVSSGVVSVGGTVLSQGSGETVIGTHDFTGDRVPELVVARRSAAGVGAEVYTLSGGSWKQIGRIGTAGATEIRVFRQVLSIRRGDALCSWTWHDNKFDYKASDGSSEPSLP